MQLFIEEKPRDDEEYYEKQKDLLNEYASKVFDPAIGK